MPYPIAYNHPLLPIAISLMLGILAGFSLPALLELPAFVLPDVFFTVVGIAIMAGRWPVAQSMLIMVSVVVLGGVLAVHRQQSFLAYPYDKTVKTRMAVVASEPSEKAKTTAVDLVLTANGRKVKGYLQKDERSRNLKPGDGLLFTARIAPCVERLAGGFGYRRYMEGNGFAGQCYVRSDSWQQQTVRLDSVPRIMRARIGALILRHHLLERYRLLGAADDSYGVLAAMTLGDRSALSPSLHEVYAVSGASHVLALSGLHLGILYMLLTFLTLSRRRRHIWSQTLIVTAVWAFALLTGLSVSVVRSAVMISTFALFSIGFRFRASLNQLCLSAIIILANNPYALFDAGFQLSFMAVLSILLFMPLMGSKNIVISCLQVSIAAQLGVAPLLAFYFGRFATYFLITNLIVLPTAYLILYSSLAMLIVPWPPIGAAVVSLVDWMNRILSQMNRWPLASIEGLQPSVLQVMVYYLVIACLFYMVVIWKGKRPKSVFRWDT